MRNSLKIAVYGSSKLTNRQLRSLAFDLGSRLFAAGHVLITGASTGIGEEVARGFGSLRSVGFSPTIDADDRINFPTVCLDHLGTIHHTGNIFMNLVGEGLVQDSPEARFKFRNALTAAACDVGVCIEGGTGTLTEAVNLLTMGKPLIVFENTGGITEKLGRFMKLFDLPKDTFVKVNSIEEALDALEEIRR